MKHLILFIAILLLEIKVYGQDLILGEYCCISEGILCNFKKYDECLTFQPDNKFDYILRDIPIYGSGSYNITDDTLILDFAKYDEKPNNKFKILESSNSLSDSITIEFQFFDENNDPLSFALIIISKSENFDSPKIIVGCSTDSDGKGHITIARDSSDIWLHVRYLGVVPGLIKLNNNINYKISGNLSFNNEGRINNESWRYLILSKKNKILKLKNIHNHKISTFCLWE